MHENAENAGYCTIMDRKHRVASLKRVKGDDFLVPYHCYSDIQGTNVKRIVEDGETVECDKSNVGCSFVFVQING